MFEKLRKAIHRRKEKRNNDIDTTSLMESDVAQEVIDYFEVRLRLDKTLTPQRIIKEILHKEEKIDLIDRIKRHTEFDGVIMTKMDVDTKGGSAISISYITSKPILYVGTGQGYDDLQSFDSEKFIEKL